MKVVSPGHFTWTGAGQMAPRTTGLLTGWGFWLEPGEHPTTRAQLKAALIHIAACDGITLVEAAPSEPAERCSLEVEREAWHVIDIARRKT